MNQLCWQSMYLISVVSPVAINDMPLHPFRFAMHFSASGTCFADCVVIAMLLGGLFLAKLLSLKETPDVIDFSMTFLASRAVRKSSQIDGSIRIRIRRVARFLPRK